MTQIQDPPTSVSKSHVQKILQENFDTARPVPLELTPEDVEFLLKATGLTDAGELRAHILRIQNDAAKVIRLLCRFFLRV